MVKKRIIIAFFVGWIASFLTLCFFKDCMHNSEKWKDVLSSSFLGPFFAIIFLLIAKNKK